MPSSQHLIVAGVDVSKAALDFSLSGHAASRRVNDDPAGLATLIQACVEAGVTLVVLEATGGLERRLARALAVAGLGFHIANPRQVRDLARAMGRLAKTDAIDAQVLVQYGQKLQPQPHVLRPENSEKLRELVARLRQLDKQRTAERCRRGSCQEPMILDMIEQSLAFIETQMQRVKDETHALVKADESMWRVASTLESTPGIGWLTAERLVAMLPELGRCTGRQMAKLVGVAPVNRDSGLMRGKRQTGGGRREVRHMMHMPTLVAVRYNPEIRKMYLRLLDAGKPKMVALVACMRKLLIYLNAMIRENKSWEEFIKNA